MNKRLENFIANIIVALIIIGLIIIGIVLIYSLLALAGYFIEFFITHVVDPVMIRNQTLGYILFFIAPITLGLYLILKDL